MSCSVTGLSMFSVYTVFFISSFNNCSLKLQLCSYCEKGYTLWNKCQKQRIIGQNRGCDYYGFSFIVTVYRNAKTRLPFYGNP